MLSIAETRGFVFDVDDSLLDNQPPGIAVSLHEQSRQAAARAIGQRIGNALLSGFTDEECLRMAHESPIHHLAGITWHTLRWAGCVTAEEIDHRHPLLVELMELKDQLHEPILRQHGRALPGAIDFVRSIVEYDEGRLADHLAIASTACRRDIDVFFDIESLAHHFPEDRLFSREKAEHPKPHPQLFDLAFRSLGLPESARHNVVAIDDDPRGIKSARAAGLFTVGMATRFSVDELMELETAPDVAVNTYEELGRRMGLVGSAPTAR